MPFRVSLVNLQKLTLWAWLAPASMRILAPAQNTRGFAERSTTTAHLRMLEAQPLHRVGELDIDAEIVGIELQLVAVEQAALLVDVHGQGRHLAVAGHPPMPVAVGTDPELDPLAAARPAAAGLYACRVVLGGRSCHDGFLPLGPDAGFRYLILYKT